MNVDHSSGGQGECRQQPGRQGQATQAGNPTIVGLLSQTIVHFMTKA